MRLLGSLPCTDAALHVITPEPGLSVSPQTGPSPCSCLAFFASTDGCVVRDHVWRQAFLLSSARSTIASLGCLASSHAPMAELHVILRTSAKSSSALSGCLAFCSARTAILHMMTRLL